MTDRRELEDGSLEYHVTWVGGEETPGNLLRMCQTQKRLKSMILHPFFLTLIFQYSSGPAHYQTNRHSTRVHPRVLERSTRRCTMHRLRR